MEFARWIVGGLVLAFGLYVAACNWLYIYFNSQNQKNGVDRNFSQGPIVGPVAIALGLLLLPFGKPNWLWFLLLIDPSTWILLAAIPIIIREARAGTVRLSADKLRTGTQSGEQADAGQPATHSDLDSTDVTKPQTQPEAEGRSR